jgi:predicted DNA-binding transcriptional regulator AlpA
MQPNGLLTPPQALRKLRDALKVPICRSSIYRWLTSGAIPSMRVGKRIFILTADLEEAIQKCKDGERL